MSGNRIPAARSNAWIEVDVVGQNSDPMIELTYHDHFVVHHIRVEPSEAIDFAGAILRAHTERRQHARRLIAEGKL